ncbi:hypothetical protein EIP91_000377 [Steccherinum ochraceum]|uniref:Uncharacterized protein n=1 Tax=Steccherinum ochraceum TaxID=92696 RepID=A0A4R0RG40_9APHY|nr:hypothetical protein EIP91_000377 [Steccherinum ochraceum]
MSETHQSQFTESEMKNVPSVQAPPSAQPYEDEAAQTNTMVAEMKGSKRFGCSQRTLDMYVRTVRTLQAPPSCEILEKPRKYVHPS